MGGGVRVEQRTSHSEILRSTSVPTKASSALSPLSPLAMEGTPSLLVTSYNGAPSCCKPGSAPVVLFRNKLKFQRKIRYNLSCFS